MRIAKLILAGFFVVAVVLGATAFTPVASACGGLPTSCRAATTTTTATDEGPFARFVTWLGTLLP